MTRRPYAPEDWLKRKARQNLSRRSSPEWAKAIAGLRCGRLCRLLVANIVWWDYFAKKPANPHDATLDVYKADWENMVVCRKPIRVRQGSIESALMSIGYAATVAKKRSMVVV